MSWKINQTNAYPTISLHDCRATHTDIIDGDLVFTFDDGFWLTPDNINNPHGKVLKTDRAQLCIKGFDAGDVYIFRETRLFRKLFRTTRQAITVQHLAAQLNSGRWQLEFIGEHYGYQSVIYSCWIWFDRKPYHRECQFEVLYSDMLYSWNTIQKDREW